jgi:hypothetical protein
MTIIPFKRPRSAQKAEMGRRVEPPAALGGVGRASGESRQPEEVDYRQRMRQNLAALGVVVIIVVLGSWVIDQLRTYSRIRACFDAGHHNCLPLNIEEAGVR